MNNENFIAVISTKNEKKIKKYRIPKKQWSFGFGTTGGARRGLKELKFILILNKCVKYNSDIDRSMKKK